MAISGIDTSTTATDNANSRTRLSDNYDTFLVLLTAQLQNQDPLAPMDSTQFTQQLVQFSQVEQQIRTNEQLEGLASTYQSAAAGSSLAYLGREAILETPSTRLTDDGGANWAYALESSADEVTLTVKDARGRTVYTHEGERSQGDHLLSWDGKDADGETVPPGIYTLVVSAKNEADEAVKTRISVREEILGVDFSSTSPQVITSSGSHGLDTVRAILDGS